MTHDVRANQIPVPSSSVSCSWSPGLATFFLSVLIGLSPLSGVLATTTTFDQGTEGWSVSGRDDISATGGNPGANMDVELIDVFGADIRNDSNPAFLGNLATLGTPLRLAVDIQIGSINFFGTEVSRDLVVELVDYNPPGSNYPYVSVYFPLGTLTSSLPGWRRFEVTIADPLSALLPAGWGGTGAEDPITFEPQLPADRTFTSVLASVDELRFTTFVPGFFFGFTNFEMQVDNPTMEVVPEPTGSWMWVLISGLLLPRIGKGRVEMERSGSE